MRIQYETRIGGDVFYFADLDTAKTAWRTALEAYHYDSVEFTEDKAGDIFVFGEFDKAGRGRRSLARGIISKIEIKE